MNPSTEDGKPPPTPRPRLSKSVVKDQYENYKLPNHDASEVKEINCPPVPSPRTRSKPAEEPKSSLEAPLNNLSEPSSSLKATGAIRKVPNVKNNLETEATVHMHPDDIKRARDFDVISQTSSSSVKSGGDGKFHTPSPG